MTSRRLRTMTLIALVSGTPSIALAHIRLDVPKARTTPNLKTGPCGASTSGTPQEIEGWTAGATVTIEYVETIDHPSHYRVALSREGESSFVDPVDADDKTTDGNELRDDIEDLDEGNNRKGSFEIVLPDEPCENCVLQFMQIMYDKPAMPFYYQCADVVIAPGETSGGSGGSANTGVGGASGVGGSDGIDAAGGVEAAGGAQSGIGGAASGIGGVFASGGAASGIGGAFASGGAPSGSGAGGLIAAGGSISGVGGSEFVDDGSSSPAGGCSVAGNSKGIGGFGLLGFALLGALGVRRLRAPS